MAKIQKSYNNIIFEFNNEYRDVGVNLNDIFVKSPNNWGDSREVVNNDRIDFKVDSQVFGTVPYITSQQVTDIINLFV